MRKLVIAVLTASAFSAVAQTCPSFEKQLGDLRFVEPYLNENLARDREAKLDRHAKLFIALSDCAKATGQKFDFGSELKRLGYEMTAEKVAVAEKAAAEMVASEAGAEQKSAAAKEEAAKASATRDVAALAAAKERYNYIENADPGRLSEVARTIATEAEIAMISAKGAVQVSQLADQAQITLSRFLIKQNDEIIRLLRVIAKEKK
jgi:hypothetical protein